MGSLRLALCAGLTTGLLAGVLTGCTDGTPNPPSSAAASTTGAPMTTAPAPSLSSPAGTVTPVPLGGATAAPSWLGTRVLARGSDGYGKAGSTPPELRDRRIITKDLLPPPADGGFHSQVQAVPPDVARRSTWTAECPVTLDQLRYVTVSFVGFDRRVHTGELLVNRSVADDVVTVFKQLYSAGWPIEEMRITSPADLSAPPTGDGNDTSAFACRDVRGGTTTWSQHAYGLAIDLDPFQNPYIAGRTVLPELARSYTDRGRGLPGMITPGSVPERAFRSIGWGWGGDYSSKKDWMHFSSTGK